MKSSFTILAGLWGFKNENICRRCYSISGSQGQMSDSILKRYLTMQMQDAKPTKSPPSLHSLNIKTSMQGPVPAHCTCLLPSDPARSKLNILVALGVPTALVSSPMKAVLAFRTKAILGAVPRPSPHKEFLSRTCESDVPPGCFTVSIILWRLDLEGGFVSLYEEGKYWVWAGKGRPYGLLQSRQCTC